jgi:AraC-like DNA-binding protein
VTVTLEESAQGVGFVHRPPALDPLLDAIRGDIAMAILYDMCRKNFGRAFNARGVAFRRAAPADSGPYEAFFGCPVEFGADANRLLIGVAEADHALPTGNRDVAALHDRVLVEQLARLDKKDVMARFRASVLERMTSGDLSEENLARDLHMSRRSLQRRLAEAEATYQSLVEETRREMALRYLADPDKSATDIAFLLGYSQQSAFTRAFRRWTGKSPSAYRSSKAPAAA